ncbi:MAG TPA: hypothetical protein VFM21_01385 [Terriglobia bacterium]|nr:hypothetical protein [Terriglobia bacterium]
MRPYFLMILLLLSPVALRAQETGSKKQPRTYSIPLPPPADFSAFGWLLGDWSGKTLPKSPQGDVKLSVAPDLGGRFLFLRGTVTLAATDSTPPEDEFWMGVLGPGKAKDEFALRVYSSTGFVTQYRVTAQKAEIRFLPEGGEAPPPGWLFRRVIARSAPGELTDTVEAAPPDGAFFQYYSAKLTRQDAEKAAPAKPPATPSEKPH